MLKSVHLDAFREAEDGFSLPVVSQHVNLHNLGFTSIWDFIIPVGDYPNLRRVAIESRDKYGFCSFAYPQSYTRGFVTDLMDVVGSISVVYFSFSERGIC